MLGRAQGTGRGIPYGGQWSGYMHLREKGRRKQTLEEGEGEKQQLGKGLSSRGNTRAKPEAGCAQGAP